MWLQLVTGDRARPPWTSPLDRHQDDGWHGHWMVTPYKWPLRMGWVTQVITPKTWNYNPTYNRDPPFWSSDQGNHQWFAARDWFYYPVISGIHELYGCRIMNHDKDSMEFTGSLTRELIRNTQRNLQQNVNWYPGCRGTRSKIQVIVHLPCAVYHVGWKWQSLSENSGRCLQFGCW